MRYFLTETPDGMYLSFIENDMAYRKEYIDSISNTANETIHIDFELFTENTTFENYISDNFQITKILFHADVIGHSSYKVPYDNTVFKNCVFNGVIIK